jgi:hypothetical protein
MTIRTVERNLPTTPEDNVQTATIEHLQAVLA